MVLTDAQTNIIDVFLSGALFRRTVPKVSVPLLEWQSSTVSILAATNLTWQRVGIVDRDTREDWALRIATLGGVNADLFSVFEPKVRSMPVQPVGLIFPNRELNS